MFNTLKYAQALKNAGVPDKQAEAQAEVLYRHLKESVATREQLELVETRIQAELGKLHSSIKWLTWGVGLTVFGIAGIYINLLSG